MKVGSPARAAARARAGRLAPAHGRVLELAEGRGEPLGVAGQAARGPAGDGLDRLGGVPQSLRRLARVVPRLVGPGLGGQPSPAPHPLAVLAQQARCDLADGPVRELGPGRVGGQRPQPGPEVGVPARAERGAELRLAASLEGRAEPVPHRAVHECRRLLVHEATEPAMDDGGVPGGAEHPGQPGQLRADRIGLRAVEHRAEGRQQRTQPPAHHAHPVDRDVVAGAGGVLPPGERRHLLRQAVPDELCDRPTAHGSCVADRGEHRAAPGDQDVDLGSVNSGTARALVA